MYHNRFRYLLESGICTSARRKMPNLNAKDKLMHSDWASFEMKNKLFLVDF